jgi:hypothetical protein
MLFTGMLQQLMTEMTPPLPPPPPPSAEKQPVRLPLREHREPPKQETEDQPAPLPPINFVVIAPVIVPAPPPPPQVPPPALETKSDLPVPVAADTAPSPSPTPDPALVVAVRNTDVVVVAKAPDVKEGAPPEHHDEIPESSAVTEPIEPVAITRPAVKVEAPKPVAMAEQAMPEKTPPVRAVAIEFRPDGVHDVRVRLAEHAGEVHVSVHSADPEVTQNLREGVTGLTATLAQAGYDARAWTPDQGQKQQQPREERAAKREKRAADTKFEGALEEVSQ